MKQLFLFCWISITISVYGQQFADKDYYLLDSIDLSTMSDKDTATLNSYFRAYYKAENDTLKLGYLENMAARLKDLKLAFRYHMYYSDVAKKLLTTAKDKALIKNFAYKYAIGYYNTAHAQNNLGEHTPAIENYQKALKIFQEYEMNFETAHTFNSIAFVQSSSNQDEEAIKNYEKALKKFGALKDSNGVAMCYINIAEINDDIGLEDVALEYYTKSKNISRRNGYDRMEAIAISSEIQLRFKLDECKIEHIAQLQRAKELCIKAEDIRYASIALTHMGRIYDKCFNEEKKADSVFALSVELAREANYASGVATGNWRRGEIMYLNGEYKKAIPLLENAYANFEVINDYSGMNDASNQLYKAYVETSQWKLALKYCRLFYKSEIKVHNRDLLAKTISLNEKHTYQLKAAADSTENVKKVALADQKTKFAEEIADKNKKFLWVAIAAGVLILIVALVFIYQLQLKRRIEVAEIKLAETEDKLQLERKLSSAELKAIKAQMNPHFLFNAFNSIQEFIILNKRELASNYLGKFADLMRLYLDHSREKTITLENEISTTDLYLEIEKVRFEDTLNYNIKVDHNIDISSVRIPPMLIQPFIENSLKHGLLHRKDNREMLIEFMQNDKYLTCIVEDNGVGRKRSTEINLDRAKSHKSFATSATNSRINLLNIGREEEIDLKIIDLTDSNGEALGTRVEIKIPLNFS